MSRWTKEMPCQLLFKKIIICFLLQFAKQLMRGAWQARTPSNSPISRVRIKVMLVHRDPRALISSRTQPTLIRIFKKELTKRKTPWTNQIKENRYSKVNIRLKMYRERAIADYRILTIPIGVVELQTVAIQNRKNQYSKCFTRRINLTSIQGTKLP